MKVSLTWSEMLTASLIGVCRQIQNLRVGRVDRYGAPVDDGWTLHIEGACGEMAVAKACGLYWSGALGELKAKDVGDIQVRTAAKENYRLMLHPGDSDSAVWVLVIGRAPDLDVVGWCMGYEGKQQHYWADPKGGRPAFFVPRSVMHDMNTFPIPLNGGSAPQ